MAGLLAVGLTGSACGLRASHEAALAAIQARDGSAAPGAPSLPATGATAIPSGTGTLPRAGGSTGPTTITPGGSGGNHRGGSQNTAAGAAAGGGGGAGDGGANTGPQCSGPKSTLTIGTVGEQSGVFAPSLLPGVQAVQAWVAAVNAGGGVACHPIRYIVKDDGGDPSTSQSQVQQLVEQDHIVAMVDMDSPIAGNASVRYLTEHRIPVIGSEGGSDWFYSSPVYFPQLTSGNNAVAGIIDAIAAIAKGTDKHTVGTITCIEVQLCSSAYAVAPGLAAKQHLRVAYRGQVSLTQPDFTSSCQSAQRAGVNYLDIGLDTNSIERVIKDCTSIGFHPLYFTGGPLETPSLAADPQAEGFYVASYVDLYNDTANPQIRSMRAALAKYAPGLAPSIGTTVGWAAAQLFQWALEHAATPTSAGLLKALVSVRHNDLGGITQPLTFTAGHDAPRVTCFWLGQIHNGDLRTPPGKPAGRICAS
ncbi:MAG TPA: ABC transporter substrate-binding protein [Mycobacteriales bacterium]|nr:ABC transporter substrate-binding protein [Mycobacteriales bacterium]